jgi:RNA polymerase sigma-70 factor (ECF subfamily)
VRDPDLDGSLVRRFLDGDQSAFETLVERHQGRVYNVCLRILGDPDDARDAAQDTFLTVVRKLGQFRGEAAFTTWLHRITVNACYDELRRKRRRPVLHVAHDPSDDRPAGEPGPASPDHAERVTGSLDAAAALARVPQEFRIALVLADVEDMAYEEIARVLDVPVGTVKSRVHRGRLALARAMGLSRAPREPQGPVGSSEGES